jgi:transposase
MEVSTIGLDIAKGVFQIHGVDAAGAEVLRKRLRRGSVLSFFAALPATLVGLEACATAHYWGRELRALGHEVRLLPPRYVKAYVRRNKTDAADAAALCEAVRRVGISAVPIKSEAQQAVLVLHRTRELLVRQRTMTANALRGHLAEFGIVAAQGAAGLRKLMTRLGEMALPEEARFTLELAAAQWRGLDETIGALERRIVAWHKSNETSRRLATIPGIGPLTASALAASVGEPRAFKTGRHFAAWLGLTPREWSSGMKRRQGGISKRGDGYLRRLLILGAHAVMRQAGRRTPRPGDPWLSELSRRRPNAVVAVALANKMARIAWVVMTRGETYHQRPLAA